MCCFCCAPRAFITHLDYAIHGMTYTLGIPNSTGGSTKIHHPQKMVAVLDTTNVYTIEISSCISYSWIFFILNVSTIFKPIEGERRCKDLCFLTCRLYVQHIVRGTINIHQNFGRSMSRTSRRRKKDVLEEPTTRKISSV